MARLLRRIASSNFLSNFSKTTTLSQQPAMAVATVATVVADPQRASDSDDSVDGSWDRCSQGISSSDLTQDCLDLTASDPLTCCSRTYIHLENLRAIEEDTPRLEVARTKVARQKIGALEEVLDIQLRNLQVKVTIESLHGIEGAMLQQALVAAIDAADIERGPFQPGTKNYEELLSVVKQYACRRQVAEIERNKRKLEQQLIQRDIELQTWQNRLKESEDAAATHSTTEPFPMRHDSLPVKLGERSAQLDPRSPRVKRRQERAIKVLGRVVEEQAQIPSRVNHSLWRGVVSRDHSGTSLSVNSSGLQSDDTSDEDYRTVEEYRTYHAF